MINNINCPVSVDKVDENVTRTAANVMVVFLVPAVLLNLYLPVLLIGFDFGLRAFTDGKYSFIRAISKFIVRKFKLNKKPIDAAPKKFAAGLGMVFSILIGISLYIESFTFAYLFGAILAVCALLEGIFVFCVGCHVYSWIIAPFYKLQQVKN